MRPSEVRARILADHDDLRRQLEGLEELGRQVRDGERALVGSLRGRAELLLKSLLEHMQYEDRLLKPALRAADAWGKERVARLEMDHREQREMLEYTLEALEDQSRPAVVLARNLLDLVALIREDMADEETHLLDERALRDDVVSIDAETG